MRKEWYVEMCFTSAELGERFYVCKFFEGTPAGYDDAVYWARDYGARWSDAVSIARAEYGGEPAPDYIGGHDFELARVVIELRG